jgi:hypothetical protein
MRKSLIVRLKELLVALLWNLKNGEDWIFENWEESVQIE